MGNRGVCLWGIFSRKVYHYDSQACWAFKSKIKNAIHTEGELRRLATPT